MAYLPVDHVGRVVPWFVAWIAGRPDHRVVRQGAAAEAVRHSCCWLCGDDLEDRRAFVIGPMCSVNRLSAEPPMHPECAAYAVQVCPFLTKPHMRRREAGMPEEAILPSGIMLKRNPGVTLVWTVGRGGYVVERSDDGMLFRLSDPVDVAWYCRGMAATREEAEASLESGLPKLRELADLDGVDAHFELHVATQRARRLLPDG